MMMIKGMSYHWSRIEAKLMCWSEGFTSGLALKSKYGDLFGA